MKRIALVAGRGKLPSIFARCARKKGAYVAGIAIRGITPPELESHVDKIHWFELTDTKKALETFRNENLKFIVMTGKIPKDIIYNKKLNLNKDVSNLFKNTMDSRDYSLIKAVASRLKKEGLVVMDSTAYLSDLLAKKGLIAGRMPTQKEWQDIKFGWKAAKRIAGMDIGQTVVIKKKLVVAVEAIEGTDAAIKRAGAVSGPGTVVVKVARPRQDMRFDVPTIGPETIDSLIDAGAAVLAIEARKTLVVDKDEITKKALSSNLSVIAI